MADDVAELYRAMYQSSLDGHQATIAAFTKQVKDLRRDLMSREQEIAALVAELRRYTAMKVE